jgi:hypothetical protein
MTSDSFGIFDTDQAFEPANDQISINDVSNKFDSLDDYLFRERERQFQLRGETRVEQHEERYQNKTAALNEIGEGAICPMDKCDAILAAQHRVFHKGVGAWICIQCNVRDGKPCQKIKRVKPDTCTTEWCDRSDKETFA